MNEITIRPMVISEIKQVVIIHLRTFEGFFLSFLGPKFLKELYRAIVEDSGGVAFIAENNEGMLGFVAGSINIRELYRNMIRKHLFRFAWASMGAFLRKPTIFFRLVRALRMPSQKEAIPNCSTLMSIAVLPEAQGNGIGKRLVYTFIDEIRNKKGECVVLTTDRDNNEAVNQFYIKLGFSILRTYATPEGRWINEYIISLDPLKIP